MRDRGCSSRSTSPCSATSAAPSDSERVLTPVREALGLEPGELLVNCSHTHARAVGRDEPEPQSRAAS